MTPLPMTDPARFAPYGGPDERFKHCEVQVNTACDLACFGCDRFSDVINDHNMTLAQVSLFVNESLELGWEWERIRLLGGEPTLHPQFMEMVEELKRYRRSFPKVFLQVLTNGQGKAAKFREALVADGISLHAEYKEKGTDPPWFHNTRLCVADDPSAGEVPPCGIFALRGCGVGLSRYGYFLDGAGASAARVAGIDIGVMALRDVTWESMWEQSRVLCRICGHWNPLEGPIRTEKVSITGKVVGPYWTEALARYNREKPTMRIYGEGK